MLKLAIVIPARNEEKRIGRTLESYGGFFLRAKKEINLYTDILVVVNNTTDRTGEIVEEYSKKYKFISLATRAKKGKGYGVIEGFKYLIQENYDLIGFVDADLAITPDQFFKLVKNIDRKDGIIASRYVRGSRIIPSPTIQRLIAKKLFNLLIRFLLLLPYEDTQCGAKIFRKEVIERVIPELSMSQWAFDVDLLYNLKKMGYKIISCPIIWRDEKYSTINFWQAGPWMVMAVLRLRIINSPFRHFIKIYDKLVGFVPK